MTRFEYTLTLLTIFAGLIFAEILAHVMAVVRALDREIFFLLPILWAGLVLLLVLQWWWNLWQWRQVVERNLSRFFDMLLFLSIPVFLYCASTFLFPDIGGAAQPDLRSYYFAHRAGFAISCIATLLMLSAVELLFLKHSILSGTNIVRVVSILSFIACAIWADQSLHFSCFTLNAALMIWFIGYETPDVRPG
jgi:hypothetical protein